MLHMLLVSLFQRWPHPSYTLAASPPPLARIALRHKVPLSEFDASLVSADNYLVCFEGLYNVAPTTCCGTLPLCLPYLQPLPSDGISITFAGLVQAI